MGALIPEKCKNFVLSGRNISGDFYMEKHGICAQEVEFSMIKDIIK